MISGIHKIHQNHIIHKKKRIKRKKKLKDTKGVIRIRKSNENRQKKNDESEEIIYKTLSRKWKIEQHKLHKQSSMNTGAPEGLEVPVPLMKLVM